MSEPDDEIAAAPEQSDAPARQPAPSPFVRATMDQMTQQLETVIDAAERAAEAIRHDAEQQARHHLAEAQRKADRQTAERVALISDLTDDLVRHAGTVRDHSEKMIEALEAAIGSVGHVLLEQENLPAHAAELEPGDDVTVVNHEQEGTPEGIDVDEPGFDSRLSPFGPGGRESAEETPELQPREAAEGSVPWYVPYPSPGPAESGDPEAEADDEESVTDEDTEDPTGGTDEDDAEAEPAEGDDALLRATQLAAAGSDRDEIAAALRDEHGIDDPEPLLDRVLGES